MWLQLALVHHVPPAGCRHAATHQGGRGLCSGPATMQGLLPGLLTLAAGRRKLEERGERMSVRACGQVLVQAVDGLAFMHCNGWLHNECVPVAKQLRFERQVGSLSSQF